MPKYRSKLEELTAQLLKKHKIKFEYESVKIKYTSPVQGGICGNCGKTKNIGKRRNYLPDFILTEGLTERRIIESKGILSSSERTKFLAIRKSNPGISISFVFGADNRLSKAHKRRYSDWCKEHGFEFGVRQLPEGLSNLHSST